MDKLCPCDVAAKDVGVGGIAEGDYGVIAATTQLTSDKELACIASEGLVRSHQLNQPTEGAITLL